VLKPYEKYKETPALWLNIIPAHWESHKIRELFVERSEKVSDKDYSPLSVSKAGVVPQISTVAKTNNGDNRKLVRKGDFVINSRSDRRGSSGISNYDGSVSLINIVLKPRSFVNGRYMHYLLKSHYFIEEFYRNGRGIVADLWTTRYTEMKSIYLPVPTIEEQDQIVRFLDWKLAKINKLIRAKKKQIALLNEQKQVIINHAVTKGLDPNVPMKDSGIEWIGTIPEHWKVLYLSQTATEQSISNKDIRNQNLLSLSYGKIINKDINTTDGLLPASFDTYQIVHNGNIILRLTDLQNDHKSLRVGLVTQTRIITSAYTCLLPRRNVVPEFLYLLLHSYDVSKVFYGMGGGVRQSIGFDDIRRLLIPVPPLGEQKQIVDFCYTKSDFIEGLIVSIEKEILLLTEYRTRLISDVVTGKVDVHGIVVPDYESIEEITDDELQEDEEADDVEEME
jgi:type I restriction enzyme S subunit